MTETQDRRRSSIFRRISLLGSTTRRASNNSSAVWEVRTDDDLGLDLSPVKRKNDKPRPRTLEKPSSPVLAPTNTAPTPAEPHTDSPRTIERLGNPNPGPSKNNESALSVASARTYGSAYSNSSDRPRPRTLEGNIPPISPLATPSAPSVTSSERSSKRRSSHIQLIPKSMLSAQNPSAQSDEMRRLEKELQLLGAQERKARGESLDETAQQHQQRPQSRNFSENGDRRSSRSDTSPSPNGAGKVRIQYVPRKSISLDDHDANLTAATILEVIPAPGPTLLSRPNPSFIEPPKRRITRSLTAVTEETPNNSEYHSDIEEEEEEETKDEDQT